MMGSDFVSILQARAAKALALWGLDPATARLIKYRENAVFRIRLTNGADAALRLHRPGYHNRNAILSELRFVAHLVAEGARAPAPLPARDGSLLVESETLPGGQVQYASIVAWMEGTPLGESSRPLVHRPEDAERLFFDLGASLARLHDIADHFAPDTGFTRPRWDFDGLIGDTPLWGRFWDCPTVTHGRQRQLHRLRQRLEERVQGLSPETLDFGLIHADAVRENVMVSDEGVGLIDFDDCGYGFRLFDLATALLRNRVEPNYRGLEAALINGYRGQRALADDALGLLPVFIVLRSLTYIGWAASRPEMAHKAEQYAADALDLARRLL